MLALMVDGDNLFRALAVREPAAIERFLQRLEMKAVDRDWEVTVVFDGPSRFLPRETGPLVIRYATGKSADTLIERLVYQATDRGQVVVVTQDRAEANLVLGLGARVWSAQRLMEELSRQV
ncbi:MAG: NYN domain-containing protein [Candidatus Omnitrophica bacterium]|nr:NYN domain-containing protein [Candidatus Omnitrophota bacterium]